MSNTKRQRNVTSLVGKFFHTFDDEGYVYWQGRVTGMLSPDLVVVELFEWLIGSASDEVIVRLDDLITPVNGRSRFAIYDSAEIMKGAYEAIPKRPSGSKRKSSN